MRRQLHRTASGNSPSSISKVVVSVMEARSAAEKDGYSMLGRDVVGATRAVMRKVGSGAGNISETASSICSSIEDEPSFRRGSFGNRVAAGGMLKALKNMSAVRRERPVSSTTGANMGDGIAFDASSLIGWRVGFMVRVLKIVQLFCSGKVLPDIMCRPNHFI